MGIQINGQTDIISATDGSLTVSGANLGNASASNLNISGIVTASGFTGNVTGNLTGNVTGNLTGNVNAGVVTASSSIVVAAGSVSAPSISPSGDSNTGIFFPDGDTVSIGEGGTEVIRVHSLGRVLVGTANTNIAGAPSNKGAKQFIYTAEGNGEWALQARHDSTTGNGLFVRAGNNSTTYTARFTGYDENNVHLNIDGLGRVTAPYQVSFAARVATQQTNVTGNAVYFTLIADSTSATGSHNVGSHYSTSTGVFTAPVTGRYYFNAHVLYDNSVLTRSGELWLSYNNDSTRWFLDRRYWASGTNITAIGGSVVINVTAGDNIRVRGFVAGGAQDVDVQGSGEPIAHFSGYLLG